MNKRAQNAHSYVRHCIPLYKCIIMVNSSLYNRLECVTSSVRPTYIKANMHYIKNMPRSNKHISTFSTTTKFFLCHIRPNKNLVRINLLFYLFFTVALSNSCLSFLKETFSTGLVGVEFSPAQASNSRKIQ